MTNFAYAAYLLAASFSYDGEAPLEKHPDYLSRDFACAVVNVYHEAQGEPFYGKIAVTKTVINRVKSDRFPNTFCKVVYQKAQFSWTGHKSKIVIRNKIDKQAYYESKLAVKYALLLDRLGVKYLEGVDHYHTTSINPVWGKNMEVVGTIGNHVFKKGG